MRRHRAGRGPGAAATGRGRADGILLRVQAVLQGFALIGALIGVGWLVAHLRVFGERDQQVLSRLTFYVASPALILTVVAEADLGAAFSGTLVALVSGTVAASALYTVLATLLWRREVEHTTIGALSVAYVNAGNLGIPIAAYVLGDATYAVPMLLFQLLVVQPVGLAVLDSRTGAPSWRRRLLQPLTNPMTLGSLGGFVLAVTGAQLPALVGDPVELLAAMAIPAMLMAYGISLRLGPLPVAGGSLVEITMVAGIKLVVMPLVTALTGRYVLDLDAPALLAATVIAALPTAQNVFVLAVRYARGVTLARDAIFATTMLSVPVMLGIVAVLS